MKKNIAQIVLGFLLVGCNVMESPNEPEVEQVGATCVLTELYIQKVPISPEELSRYSELEDDTLRLYYGTLEGGREVLTTKSTYNTLNVGDLFPGCGILKN